MWPDFRGGIGAFHGSSIFESWHWIGAGIEMVTVEPTPEENRDIAGLAWRASIVAPYVFWVILTVGGLALRPPTAPIELELLASSWRMYLDGGIVPAINGIADPGVAPLVPWLTALVWSLFGESENWPRLISSLSGLATLILIGRNANLLWPHRAATPVFSRLLLVGLGGFTVSLTMIEPEMLALPFTLLVFHALAGIWLTRPTGRALAWARALALIGAVLAGFAAGWVWAILPIVLGWLMALLDQANAPPRQRRWLIETGLIGLAAIGAVWLWQVLASLLAGTSLPMFFELGNGWLDPGVEASRREAWTLVLLPIVLYPWICWKTLWRALDRHLRETLGTGFRIGFAALLATSILGLASGWKLQGMLPIAVPLALLGARLLATQAIKPRDFHAAVPGFIALLVGLFFFLMNIIPTAHLDALWREVFGISLPIWLGGIGLVSGLALLAIAYGLTQMSPSQQVSRTLQVAVLPILLMTSLNLEFAGNLKPFFDLHPVAERLRAIQDAGQQVAVYGPYRGEFDFAGRLGVAPTPLRSRAEAAKWANDHLGGAIVTYFDGSPIRLPVLPIYRGVARDRWVAVWPASALTSSNGAILSGKF